MSIRVKEDLDRNPQNLALLGQPVIDVKKIFRTVGAPLGFPLAVIIYVAVATSGSAQPTAVPSITLDALGLGISTTYSPPSSAFQLASDGKTWELAPNGDFAVPGAPFVEVLDLQFDPDPIVYGNVLIQNITATPQTYTFGYSLLTTFLSPNLIRGSIDTSLVGTDAKVSAVAGGSIYSAQIDFSTIKTLQDAPFSLSTPQAAVSSTAQFGFDLSAIPVTSSIGIELRFELSPGDTVSIVSDFEVVRVPEPGIAGLVLLGTSLLVLRRRRS